TRLRVRGAEHLRVRVRHRRQRGNQMGVGSMRKIALLVTASFACSCGFFSGETVDRVGEGEGAGVPDRHGTVVSDGCTPDAWQTATLSSNDFKRVVKEIVLLCAVPRYAGGVGPQDPSARGQLAATQAWLRTEGFSTKLAVSFTDETAERYD